MLPDGIRTRLLDLERKGVVRIVRTAAGAKRYNQPIGSVIVLDTLPKGKRDKPKRPKVSKAPDRPAEVDAAVRVQGGRPSGAVIAPTPLPRGARNNAKVDGKAYSHTDLEKDLDGWNWSWISPEAGYDAQGHSIRTTRRNGKWVATYRYTGAGAFPREQEFEADSLVKAKDLAAAYLRRRYDRLYKKTARKDSEGRYARNEKARSEGNLLDTYPGVRGVDWWYDDDREVDWDDPEDRYAYAVDDLASIGVTWNDKREGNGWYTDVAAMETVNAVLHAHNDEYPGFATHMLDSIGVDGTRQAASSSFIAYNQIMPGGLPRYREDGSLDMDAPAELYMGLNAKYFGGGWDRDEHGDWSDGADIFENLERIKDDKTFPYKFHAVKYGELAEDADVEPWEAAVMAVVTHELGHSVGRVIFSEFAQGREGQRGIGEEDVTGNWFREDLLKILDKYGVLGEAFPRTDPSEDNEILRQVQFTAQNRALYQSWQEMPARMINREALEEQLSTYGSYNFHEMMAETWASYQLSREPTQFVRELGGFMERVVDSYIEESDALAERES